jgi:sodium-dependent dicarboxylate transporter 2/3/5
MHWYFLSLTGVAFMTSFSVQAKNVDISLVYLGFPANQASNFAFMLPVATGPNAIVYSFGHLKVIDMVSVQCFFILQCSLDLCL